MRDELRRWLEAERTTTGMFTGFQFIRIAPDEDQKPAPVRQPWELTEADRTFLRVQRIDANA